MLAEHDAILFRQAPGASGRGNRATTDSLDSRGDRRQADPGAETAIYRSGQLPGREVAWNALLPLGAAASDDCPHRNETSLRHVLSIAIDRGSAGTTELTDRLALSAAGAGPGRNAGDPAEGAGAGCDGGSYRDDSQRDGRSLPERGYDDPATARVETAQREETGGGKREDAGPGQHRRQPPDDLRPDFGKCCGALR